MQASEEVVKWLLKLETVQQGGSVYMPMPPRWAMAVASCCLLANGEAVGRGHIPPDLPLIANGELSRLWA